MWSFEVCDAVEEHDGGNRSFPNARDTDIACKYSYHPPNEDYEGLFTYSARLSWAQRDKPTTPHCAGWLIPEAQSTRVSKPLFIAHSLLAAIWLLRETVGGNALPAAGWESLVRAAQNVMIAVPMPSDIVQETPAAGLESITGGMEWVPPFTQRALDGTQAPETPTRSPKRVQVDLEDSPTSSKRSRLSIGPTPALSVAAVGENRDKEPVRYVKTTTNNNRRSEKQREKKMAALRVKKRAEIGLEPPGPKAPAQEVAAYSAITEKDELTIAWMIKQTISGSSVLYSASSTPYHTACTILEKVRTLGNPSSQCNAAQFLQTWRQQGTPFQMRVESQSLQSHAHLQQELVASASQGSSPDNVFSFAWEMCKAYDQELAAIYISSRWALALLGEAYTQKIQQIRHQDMISSNDRTRNRYGKGPVRTEAITALIKLVYPEPTKKQHEVFRARLKQAMRWHSVVQGLGWGSLLLIPHEEIPHRWIERVLRVGELAVFINVVKRERPDLVDASKALESWLGPDGIAGGPISQKQTLGIESNVPLIRYEIEEIADSEEEEEDEVGTQQSPVTQESTAPAPLRQMSLLQLFHPVSTAESTE